jgi:hypothetical protein
MFVQVLFVSTRLQTLMRRSNARVMAKADRLKRLDEYIAAFTNALRVTASGKWGLFDHNEDRWTRAAFAPVIENLTEIGQAIDKMRDQLGMPPFELQQRFLAARGPVEAHAMGEPKQAQAWLNRIKSDQNDGA